MRRTQVEPSSGPGGHDCAPLTARRLPVGPLSLLSAFDSLLQSAAGSTGGFTIMEGEVASAFSACSGAIICDLMLLVHSALWPSYTARLGFEPQAS